MTFDPTAHLVKLKGNALYLPVTWRLVWLREEHPDATVVTEMVTMDLDRDFYVFRATVTLPNGASATGYGSETAKDFPAAPLEKAETKALGRALAALGLGTQFALEIEESDSGAAAGRAETRQTTQARSGTARSGNGAGGAAKEATLSTEEQEARLIVRGRLAAAFPDMSVGTWRELVSFAHEKYDLEVPTPEQEQDPAFRLGYLQVFAGRLPLTAAEGTDEGVVQEYRARLEEASSVAAISAIMHEAKESGRLGAALLKDLALYANERAGALRSAVR